VIFRLASQIVENAALPEALHVIPKERGREIVGYLD